MRVEPFTKSERNYSQVEKEAFACMWACEHYHIYLFGSMFTLVTDNRAVSIILDKNCDSRRRTPIRLQLWRSRFNQYNFDVRLTKSDTNIADYLSRCLKIENKHFETDYTSSAYRINSIIAHTEDTLSTIAQESNIKNKQVYQSLSLSNIRKETLADPIISKIICLLKNGKKLSNFADLKNFHSLEQDLCITADEILLKEDKIVLPTSLTQFAVDVAHMGHLGPKLCQRLLKEHYFFPGIDKMVNHKIEKCKACDANIDTTRFNPLISNPMP